MRTLFAKFRSFCAIPERTGRASKEYMMRLSCILEQLGMERFAPHISNSLPNIGFLHLDLELHSWDTERSPRRPLLPPQPRRRYCCCSRHRSLSRGRRRRRRCCSSRSISRSRATLPPSRLPRSKPLHSTPLPCPWLPLYVRACLRNLCSAQPTTRTQ